MRDGALNGSSTPRVRGWLRRRVELRPGVYLVGIFLAWPLAQLPAPPPPPFSNPAPWAAQPRAVPPKAVTPDAVPPDAMPLPRPEVTEELPPAVPPPHLRVEVVTHDFGRVLQGTPIEHAFTLHNDGPEPLVIREVVPDCGCTAAEFEPVLAPGAQQTVKLQLDTSRLLGRVRKAARIAFEGPAPDGPGHSGLDVALTGIVDTLLAFEPAGTLRLRGLHSEPKSLTFDAVPGSPLTFTVRSLTAREGLVEVGQREIEPGRRTRFVVHAGRHAEPRVAQEVLSARVETSDGVTHEVSIPLLIEDLGPILVEPRPSIIFRPSDTASLQLGGTPPVAGVVLRATHESIRFAVTEVQLADAPEGLFEARWRDEGESPSGSPSGSPGESPGGSAGESRVQAVQIEIRVLRALAPQTVRSRVLVFTDRPDQRVVEIALYAQFAEPAALTPAPEAPPGAGADQR